MQRSGIITIFNFVYYATITSCTDSREKYIKELENIKSELYIKINDAIADSVKALRENNDTDSLLTIDNMKELKKEIEQLNSTLESDTKTEEESYKYSLDKKPEKDVISSDLRSHDNGSIASSNKQKMNLEEVADMLKKTFGKKQAENKHSKTDSISDVENRQSKEFGNLRRASVYGAIASAKNPQIQIDLKEIIDLLKAKNEVILHSKDTAFESQHTLDVKKKAEAWIAARQKERERIKAYRDQRMRVSPERCPRFGTKRIKKTISGNKSKKKKKKGHTYPCCRKCCKHSYMGCL